MGLIWPRARENNELQSNLCKVGLFGDYIGEYSKGSLRGILGVKTMAHVLSVYWRNGNTRFHRVPDDHV